MPNSLFAQQQRIANCILRPHTAQKTACATVSDTLRSACQAEGLRPTARGEVHASIRRPRAAHPCGLGHCRRMSHDSIAYGALLKLVIEGVDEFSFRLRKRLRKEYVLSHRDNLERQIWNASPHASYRKAAKNTHSALYPYVS